MAGGQLYNLLLDRKSIVVTALGLLLAGILLFVAGLVVAVRWYLPETSVARPAQSAKSVTVTVAPAVPTSEPPPAAVPPPATTVPVAAASVPAASLPTPTGVEATSLKADPQAEPAAYSIQVGAFLSEYNLDSFLNQLVDRGYQPYVVKVTSPENQVMFSVRIGRYPTEEEARQAASDFQKKVKVSAVVRAPGS